MNKIYNNKGFTFWELLIVIGIIGVLAANAIPGHGVKDPYRSCVKNIVKIREAVNLLNSKTGTKVIEFDNNTFKILLENKYLKREIFPPIEGKCKYLIKDDGTVYCEYHGSAEYYWQNGTGISPSSECLNELEEKKYYDKLKKYIPFCIIAFGVIGLMISTFKTKR